MHQYSFYKNDDKCDDDDDGEGDDDEDDDDNHNILPKCHSIRKI